MKLKPAKVFKAAVEQPQPQTPPSPGTPASRSPNVGPRHITGISFDDRGDQVVTAAEDETFRLYSCKSGKRVPLDTQPVSASTDCVETGT